MSDDAPMYGMTARPRALDAVERLYGEFGFTYRSLAAILNTSESRLRLWRLGAGTGPSPAAQARLSALDAFLTELRRTFQSMSAARAWLDVQVPALDDRSPRQMILDGYIERVTGILYALNAGVAL